MEKNNSEYKHNPLAQTDEIENSNSDSINTNKIETTSTEEEDSSNENNNNNNKIIILNTTSNRKKKKL